MAAAHELAHIHTYSPHLYPALDDRVHYTYHGSDRFVILSKVDENWRVRVGLVPDPHRTNAIGEEDEARWWQMSWSEEDAKATLDSNLNLSSIEDIANLVDDSVKTNKICLEKWDRYNPSNQVYLKIPNGPDPIRIPLREMSSEEVASFAAKVLFEIARDGPGNLNLSSTTRLPTISNDKSYDSVSSKTLNPRSSSPTAGREEEPEDSWTESQSEEELGIQKNLITSIPPTERWERDHPENGRHRSPKNKRKRKHDEQPTKSMEDRNLHDRKEDNRQVERVVTKSARPPTIPPTTPWTSRWKQKPIVMRFVGESSDEDN